MNCFEELKWRGLVDDCIPGTDTMLDERPVCVYAGFDPTAPSLQVGNLIPVMLLAFLQRHGHTPIVLLGGATALIGDPSGKSEERQLQDKEVIQRNLENFRSQMRAFLTFDDEDTSAHIVDNYEWLSEFGAIDFLRDVGKTLTINYMMAKDSVKQRMHQGLSFTEFSYQLLQGYDFYRLFKDRHCIMQVGGSDQWGNITAGCEFIRRRLQKQAYALTAPLLTRADGTKFGKTAGGQSVWLDATMTSPYAFYQFWLNCSDEDAERFVKIFSLKSCDEIARMCAQHRQTPEKRMLQQALAEEMTVRVHSRAAFEQAVDASKILFGKGTRDTLATLSAEVLDEVFDGVPRYTVPRNILSQGVSLADLLVDHAGIFASRGELKRLVRSGGLQINKEKVTDLFATITEDMLLNDTCLVVQSGKKKFHLLIVQNRQ
jgi:tyrosyl-tRNA synthetase